MTQNVIDRKNRVLVAEDDPVSRRILQKTLENWAYEIFLADNGIKASEILEEFDPGIALLDWMMPERDGVDVCRKFREGDNENYTYIIMLTAKGQKDDVIKGLESGADDYMVKPFDREELHSRIRAGERILNLEMKLAENIAEISRSNQMHLNNIHAAARIQKEMLPIEIPENDKVEFGYQFLPCDHVGGDMLNVFQLDQNHIGLFISDVMGHGVPAAMLAVTISRILTPVPFLFAPEGNYENEKLVHLYPDKIIQKLNLQIGSYSDNSIYSTLICGVIDTDSMEFRYIRAGHPPIIKLDGDTCSLLSDDGGLPVGINENAAFNVYSCNLKTGDRLYFFTDGLVENENGGNFEKQVQELQQRIINLKAHTLQESLNQIVNLRTNLSDSGTQHDDITIMGMEIK